jgi:hypothetical protein
VVAEYVTSNKLTESTTTFAEYGHDPPSVIVTLYKPLAKLLNKYCTEFVVALTDEVDDDNTYVYGGDPPCKPILIDPLLDEH